MRSKKPLEFAIDFQRFYVIFTTCFGDSLYTIIGDYYHTDFGDSEIPHTPLFW